MRWSRLPQTGILPVERSSHSITVVGDRLYLFGGEHDPRVPVGNEMYEYCFADGTWRVLEVQGEAPSPRVAHSAAAVGTVLYFFGGRSGLAMGEGASNDLYSFDVTTRTWARLEPSGQLPPKRSYHTMTSLGRKLYVFGGCGEEGRLNDLYEYDAEANAWRALAAPAAEAVPGRGGSCLVAVPDGAGGKAALYVVAGFCGRELDDMHVYNIVDDVWCGDVCPTCKSSAAGGATSGVAAAVGKLSARSVFGGAVHTCSKDACAHKSEVIAYGGEVDPSAKGHDGAGDFCASLMAYGGAGAEGWRSLDAGGESPGPRGWFAAATTPDGRFIVHGGLDKNNERLGDMFVLDVHEN
ncbi:hypothetical protein GPECTOR_63g57 [Gonium pectorale]|uniref:Uncharacterized protein n=1 Tax=Gonium pectorale TaxID=33097 RepID=A0A150G4E0_GONPE|nr:hypothetical protein GPECTOR_63g57 [Gonium pectorale]|eukprot:KXZ44732.1 hypothetical protein GPECTOR_63g57 [Gonium pectorale]